MTYMTLINQDAHARREAARDHGRFGVQEHTVPELSFDTSRAELDDLWEERKTAAAAVAEADVALIAARLHWTIAAVRFSVRDGQIRPSEFVPAVPGGSAIKVDQRLKDDIDVLAAYAQSKNPAVHLEPVHDGTDAWEWAPDGAARAVNIAEAAHENLAAREDFRNATYDLDVATEKHLTTHTPDGVDAVDIVFLPDGSAVFGYAYDEAGEPTLAQFGAEEWTDYRLIASRAPDTVHRIAEARHSDILGPHFHLQKRHGTTSGATEHISREA